MTFSLIFGTKTSLAHLNGDEANAPALTQKNAASTHLTALPHSVTIRKDGLTSFGISKLQWSLAMPFLRRLILLALLGGTLLLFAKVVIFLLVLFLGFALVGFLVWMPLHTIFCRPQQEWNNQWNKGLSHCRRFAFRYQAHWKATREYLSETSERLRTFARWLGSFLIEILSGAALGGLVMLLRLPEWQAKPLLLGILAGAAAGLLVALFVTTPQTSLNHE